MSLNWTVAVASGKGGTGKTTVSASLAKVHGNGIRLLDCDVEEPNAHLFLGLKAVRSERVGVLIPAIDTDKCTLCGECAKVCRFNSLAVVSDRVLVFPELCHSCGGCRLICPESAISEVKRDIGTLERGWAGDVEVVYGRLDIGEAQSPPLISAVRASVNGDGPVLIDAPPGTSCPVIEAVNHTDYVLMVAEPTPFGLHDLEMAVGMVRTLNIQAGVLINRAGIGDERVRSFCDREGIPILLEVPQDRRIAEAYASGHLPVDAVPGYADLMTELLAEIRERVK